MSIIQTWAVCHTDPSHDVIVELLCGFYQTILKPREGFFRKHVYHDVIESLLQGHAVAVFKRYNEIPEDVVFIDRSSHGLVTPVLQYLVTHCDRKDCVISKWESTKNAIAQTPWVGRLVKHQGALWIGTSWGSDSLLTFDRWVKIPTELVGK